MTSTAGESKYPWPARQELGFGRNCARQCLDNPRKAEQVVYMRVPEQQPVPIPLNLELPSLRNQLESTVRPGGLIGVSLEMRTIHDLIGKARDHTFPVII